MTHADPIFKASKPGASTPTIVSPATALAALVSYFLLSVVFRVLVASGLEDDESEQMLAAQFLSWGYGPQPPLFTWIQFLLQQVFGPSILAIAIQKNLILLGIVFCTYWTTREMSRSHATAILACALMLVSVELIWESQRDRTHNVLATLCAIAALAACVRVHENPTSRNYLFLGLIFGAGLLSKYSFAVVILGLSAAALISPTYRTCVLNSNSFVSIAALLVVSAPHFIWAVNHPDLFLGSSGKLYQGSSAPPSILASALFAPLLLVKKAAGIAAPLLGLGLLGWWTTRKRPKPPRNDFTLANRRFVILPFVLSLALVLLAMICLQVTSLKSRWFLPLGVGLPIWLALQFAPVLLAHEWRVVQIAGATIATVVLMALPTRHVILVALGKTSRPAMPYRQLASDLADTHPDLTVVIAEDDWLGGNLRMALPHVLFIAPETPTIPCIATKGTVVAIWNADHGRTPPPALQELLEERQLTVVPGTSSTSSEGTYRFTRDMKFSMAAIEVIQPAGPS